MAGSGSCLVSELSASCNQFPFHCTATESIEMIYRGPGFLAVVSAPRPSTVYGTESIEMIYRGLGIFAVVLAPRPSTEYGTESIEMIYRGSVFCGRICSSPTPFPLPPLQSGSCLSFSVFLCHRLSLLTGEEGGRGSEEPNHTAARKPGPLYIIKYSLV